MPEGTRPPTLPDEVWDDIYPVLRENIGVGKPLKVKRVAEVLGVSSPSVSAWLHNKNRPNTYNLFTLLKLLNQEVPGAVPESVQRRVMGDLGIEVRTSAPAPDHLWSQALPALKKNIGPKKLFTVERIARAVGVDEDTVRAWLKDEERPTTSNLTRIVQILSNHEGALPQPLIDRFYSPIDPRAPYSLPTDRQVLTVSDPRYSNREQAIALLVQDGRGDEATLREAADRAAVALDADDDAPVLRWVEMIGPFIRAARTGTDKALGERELEDDD